MRKFIFVFLGLLITGLSAVHADELFKNCVEASYYAEKYNGRKTANGETFNMNDLTAAHKTLPFNTIVKVTNLTNNKSVYVRINDRGPFVKGREIDLSKAAAVKLDMIKTGTANVKLEIVSSSTLKERSQEIAQKAQSLPSDKTWDIQLAAFSSKENAQKYAKLLRKDGFKDIALLKIKNKNIVRVVIRQINTDDVQYIIEKLEKKGHTDYLVKESI